MIHHEYDQDTPGGVYLCQTGETMSCGACCGLYNVAEPDCDSLTKLLRKRTGLFEKTPRDFDSLVRFKEQVESMENQKRPYPEFHHCPYLGFVGESLTRPGCLLHPLNTGNNGVDRRGLSEWGGLACATYFCPTCGKLPARYKQLLRMCCGNWHIYGLVIPETEMLSTYFSLIEQQLGHDLEVEGLSTCVSFQRAVRDFFQLKTDWPFRPEGFKRLGNYFFNDNLYPRTPIDYTGLGCDRSDKDALFKALGSEFKSRDELESADRLLTTLIHQAVAAASLKR